MNIRPRKTLSFVTDASPGGVGTRAGRIASDREIIEHSFDAWASGTGSPYDLLADDARWTIAGRSAVAGTYDGREAFLRQVIGPFNARMREPLRPIVHGIYADRNIVIVLFDASGIALDGQPYRNTYSWFLRMRGGTIVGAAAFFDSIAFNDLWSRVSPAPEARH